MKKIFTFLFVTSFTFTGFSQTQRLVLVEEFTQASCGPCASQNPAFNTLLQSGTNPTKAVSLKYQTDWPGYDPMNIQNPTDVQTRVDFYAVSGVPNASIDGVDIPDDCNAYVGAPACLNQAKIDAAYAIPSPVGMVVTHYLSSDLDSIYIHVDISNATMVSLGMGWKLQVAITEKEINFTSAPGSNGELEFFDVMRKMIPNASGTTLSAIAASGMVSFDFNVPLPTYIYNYGEIGVVAFVQDDATKTVQQAGLSDPQPIPVNNNYTDAGAVNQTSGPAGGLCDNQVTPSVQITNNFSTIITSADVSYSLNGGANVTQAWTGSISQGQNATVTFPAISAASGSNSLVGSISNINGGSAADFNSMNNTSLAVSFSVIPAATFDTKLIEGFESVAVAAQPLHSIISLPTATNPGVWVVNKSVAGSAVTWELGAFENSTKAYRWRFFTIGAGGSYPLIFEKINLTGKTNVGLVFSYAHALYGGNEPDQLKISASTNCGSSWSVLWDKSGTDLATTANLTTALYPHAADWLTESVSLAQFNNASELMIKFEGVSGFGNNLYIDDINLNSNVGTIDISNNVQVTTYPNPTSDMAIVDFSLEQPAEVSIELTNLMGQIVYSNNLGFQPTGKIQSTIDVSLIPSGVYKVSVKAGNQVTTKKLSVIK